MEVVTNQTNIRSAIIKATGAVAAVALINIATTVIGSTAGTA